MKYLKRINELFDDEITRYQFSDEYLNGDLEPKDTLKWSELKSDPLLSELLEKVPFLNSLESRRTGKILQFGFNDYKEGLYLYFDIQVVEFDSKYMLVAYAKSLLNDKVDWNVDYVKNVKDKTELVSKLKSDVYKILNDFEKYTKSEFGVSTFDPDSFKADMN